MQIALNKLDSSCQTILVKTPINNRKRTIVRWSHASEPIERGSSRGKSRSWGDASLQTQKKVISALIDEARLRQFSIDETAALLAIARLESGFNPDASATSTSATGLGQFIDRTGAYYGLNNRTRFELMTQTKALAAHFRDNEQLAQKLRPQATIEQLISLTYALHHDGPSLASGGEAIGNERLLPLWRQMQDWLQNCSQP